MNSKDFINALRKVIREEVQSAVRTELTQFSMISERAQTPARPTFKDSVKPKPAAKKQFAANSMLNDILNETAGFAHEGPIVEYNDFEEWPTMNVGTRMPMNPVAVTDLDGRRLDTSTESGAAVADALTRDYSALMKAIEKKKGN